MKTLSVIALLLASFTATASSWSLSASWDNENNGMTTCQYYSGERTQYLFVERYESCPKQLEY